MRSYGHYCAVARALDVVGDRWSLLIVRELLPGARRYRELLDGLPGIATNLLAGRLRHLERAGVVERHGPLYALTPWGSGLRQPLYALARWAAPVVMTRPAGDDAYRSLWLEHPVAVLFPGRDPRRRRIAVEVRAGEHPMSLLCEGGIVSLRPGGHPAPDLTLDGPPDAILGLLAGYLDAGAASSLGVSITGDPGKLRWLRPALPGSAAAPEREGASTGPR